MNIDECSALQLNNRNRFILKCINHKSSLDDHQLQMSIWLHNAMCPSRIELVAKQWPAANRKIRRIVECSILTFYKLASISVVYSMRKRFRLY